jgi:hypothetical protein
LLIAASVIGIHYTVAQKTAPMFGHFGKIHMV